MDDIVTRGATDPSIDLSNPFDPAINRVDTARTGEETFTISPPRDGADSIQASAVTSGLIDDAAEENHPSGSAIPADSESPDITTPTTGAGEMNAPVTTELLPPPASYACAVDPRVTTGTTPTSTLGMAPPPPSSTDFPPISGSTATEADSEGFKTPRHLCRSRGRESYRMRSRSRSTSSTDSSSGPPTRKCTQPTLVGTGHTSRRSAREVNITLGQFGALQDFVADNPEAQYIRLTSSGNLIPDSPQNGNLRPRPPAELDSSLESLLQSK